MTASLGPRWLSLMFRRPSVSILFITSVFRSNSSLRRGYTDDARASDNLFIVVEVLSPNTATIDHGRKLSGYFSLVSAQHYLIFDPDRRVVIHRKRGSGDAIET